MSRPRRSADGSDQTWPPVEVSATLGSVVGRRLLLTGEHDSAHLLLLEAQPSAEGEVRVRHAILDGEWVWHGGSSTTLLPAAGSIADAGMALGRMTVRRAGLVPEANFPWRRPLVGSMRLVATLIVLLIISLVADATWLLWPAAVVGALAAWSAVHERLRSHRAPLRDAEGKPLSDLEVRARLPRAIMELSRSGGPITPAERVGVVKDRYGELLGDIVYRIENSALFDPAVPETQRFQVALLAWDPNAPDAGALAAEVEEAFDSARRTAEQLGLDHLPDTARGQAERAVKVVGVALRGTTEEERRAARLRAAELLNSLALYYLPVVNPAAPALIGRRRSIEPRP